MRSLQVVILVTFIAAAITATVQPKKLSVERCKPNGKKQLAKMENSTVQPLTKDVKTVDCAKTQSPCSIKDKINSDNFPVQLYNDGNPIAITPGKMELSIAMTAVNVNDAAKFYHEAKHLYEKAEGEKNRLKQAKAKKSWATVRVKAEEGKAIAARLARSIIKGKSTDEQAALIEKMERAALRLWLSSEEEYPLDSVTHLLRDIDPSKTVNDDELQSLMNRISAQVGEACQIQKNGVRWTDLLKEEKDSNKRALLEELSLAAIEESKVKAALITNLLKKMASQKSLDTVEGNIVMLQEMINNRY